MTDNRLFIGLRGPVVRGWAVIVELEVGDRPGIEPQPIGAEGRRYRKHFLDMRGLGVRDLCRHGEDLLLLAGTHNGARRPHGSVSLATRWPRKS